MLDVPLWAWAATIGLIVALFVLDFFVAVRRPHAVHIKEATFWSVFYIGLAVLFGLGLGWNVSFVAATAELADATHPSERGRLLGFNDLLSGLTGAGLALLGGVALTEAGVAALAVGGAVLVLLPTPLVLRRVVPVTR